MKQKDFVCRFYTVALVLLNISCDQISKEVVRKNVVNRDYIELVADHLILTNVENTGAMLGFGASFPPVIKIILLQIIPIVVLMVLLYRVLTKKTIGRWPVFAFALVIGGGIGNLIDRIVYGSVTDFFQIRLGFLKTGIFNMADVSISIGVVMILFLSVFGKKVSI
ncbi:MAG: signal peptidase II [Maribacter sp.]